jgi:hypothetical protein
MNNFSVPNDETVYACQAFPMPIDQVGKEVRKGKGRLNASIGERGGEEERRRGKEDRADKGGEESSNI